MKSTLKIDEFEIIIEGVDDQWLKQNHHHIVEAIKAAFQPFEHREFNNNVIQELVIELPKSQSFNQFLDALLHQLRSEIVDKNVIRKGDLEPTEIPKPPSNWQTIQDLFDKLKNVSSSNSNLYQQTLKEILLLVQSNENLIWEFMSKLGLSKQLLETFQHWTKIEKISPTLIVFWMGNFIEIQKKKQNNQQDNNFLKIIFQTAFDHNYQGLTIANLQNSFVQALLNTPNQSIDEMIEYQSTIGELNNIFSAYFNEYDVIKNLINIEFIEKIIQLNTVKQNQNKNTHKIDVLVFFAALKIANSLNIQNYEQLIETLNQAYLSSNRDQFNEQQILQIFKRYLPSNQHYILTSLIEMMFQETKLINTNNDIETAIIQIFTKIDRYISDRQIAGDEPGILPDVNQSTFSLSSKNIIEQIIHFNFLKIWPTEIAILKPTLTLYFNQIFTEEAGKSDIPKFPFPISKQSEIAFIEFSKILRKILEVKSSNQSQFQTILFEYGAMINLLLLNILDYPTIEISGFAKQNEAEETTRVNDKSQFLDFNKESTIDQTIEAIWPNYGEIFNSFEINDPFLSELIKISKQQKPAQLFHFLTSQINKSFAELFFKTLHDITEFPSISQQFILKSSFLTWVQLSHEKYQSKNEFITFKQYINESKQTQTKYENQIQEIKTSISNDIIENIQNLIQENINDVELSIFTNKELKLWESLIQIIESNEINVQKLEDQVLNFELSFQIISEFWINQQNSNTFSKTKSAAERLSKLSKILQFHENQLLQFNGIESQELTHLLNSLRENENLISLLFQLKYSQIHEAYNAQLLENQSNDTSLKSNVFDFNHDELFIAETLQLLFQFNQPEISFLTSKEKNLLESKFEIFKIAFNNEIDSFSKIIAAQFIRKPIILKILSLIEDLNKKKNNISNDTIITRINALQSVAISESVKEFLYDLLEQTIQHSVSKNQIESAISNFPKTESISIYNSLLFEINKIESAIRSIQTTWISKEATTKRNNDKSIAFYNTISGSRLSEIEKAILLSFYTIEITDTIAQQPKTSEIPLLWNEIDFNEISYAENKNKDSALTVETKILGLPENSESFIPQEKNTDLEIEVELNQLEQLIQLQKKSGGQKKFGDQNKSEIQNKSTNQNDSIQDEGDLFTQETDFKEIIKNWVFEKPQIIEQNTNDIPLLTGEILMKLRNPWFHYLNKFAQNNEQSIRIKQNWNWINQLIEQNIILNVQTAHYQLIQKYAAEIESFNVQNYGLKEHLYIQNVLTLLIQFVKNEFIHIDKLPESLRLEIQKNAEKVISIIQSALEIHKEILSPVRIKSYSQSSEIDIASESKNILQNIFDSNKEPLNEWTPKNIWFQTENKIPMISIFNESESWRILFSENTEAIFIQNEGNSILPIWNKSENLKILLKHPDSKKWMVELSKNKGEGFMDLASSLSLDAIIEAHQEKYKSSISINQNIKSLLIDLKTILSNRSILEFYQFTKFQILQNQSPLTKVYLSQIYYLSYLSVSSKKTIPEISKFTKLIAKKLELNEFEKTFIQKFINEKLPTQTTSEIFEDTINEDIEIKNEQISNQSKVYLIQHILKYPGITETELIDQIELISNKKLSSTQKINALKSISIEIWHNLNQLNETIISQKQHSQFLFKIVSNWLKFKDLHFTIKYAFTNIQEWIIESKTILQTVNIHKIDSIHANWLLFDEKTRSEFSIKNTQSTLFIEFTPETIERIAEKSKSNFLRENGEVKPSDKSLAEKSETVQSNNPELEIRANKLNPLKLKELENDVLNELSNWQAEIHSRMDIPQKKAIENQQNKEEYTLELPIRNREPSILNWKQLNASNNIIQSIITILLKEGIQLNTQSNFNQELISINQFLSSKSVFRILGNSAIPIQFIGLMYEQFFGYSMGLIEENWNGFTMPQKSKSLVEKLLLLKKEKGIDSSLQESWFEQLLSFSEDHEKKTILGAKDFNLILKEIQQTIQQKLANTKFAKAHQSLQENWIQHLIFFKLIQYKSDTESIGGIYALLESHNNQIDQWIHKISDHIIFDITVEFDFWIENLSRFGNYFEESNILTLFQLSESLKLINPEIKLDIEDIFDEMLKVTETRPFDFAMTHVFIPRLVPLFYENHLSKTNQFRELNLLSLIISERNTISQKLENEKSEENLKLDDLFEEFKTIESLNVDPEILREISMIIGKNLDETSRWILHELAQSNAKKLNEFTQKISEIHQSDVKINSYYQSIINNPKLTSTIQDIISPIIINLQDSKKSDSKIKREIDSGTRFITTLCGLMMLSPFLATLFRRMGLLEKNEFVSEKEQLKAYKVLMTIPKIDEEQVYEYQDLIPRIITGIAPEDTIHYVPELTEEELTEIRNFLGAVISQWPVMANATVRGFIESFLVRDGKVWKDGSLWRIEVNGHGADIILQTLTWGFSTMKFPWTPYMIETNWLSP